MRKTKSVKFAVSAMTPAGALYVADQRKTQPGELLTAKKRHAHDHESREDADEHASRLNRVMAQEHSAWRTLKVQFFDVARL